MTQEELEYNNFPGFRTLRTHELHLDAIIYIEDLVGKQDEVEQRTCERCGIGYLTNKATGAFVTTSVCVYHRSKRPWKGKFDCCGKKQNAKGCCSADGHVDKRYALRSKSLASKKANKGAYKVLAVDTELCHTQLGYELVRVSAVDIHGKVCLDKLVKPKTPIVDPNTYFSGITRKMLKNVKTDALQAQQALLRLISPSTILVGHSLNADLMALQIKHSNVMDTSVLFPHFKGPPMKKSLKKVMEDELGEVIQENSGGHSSIEDAQACIRLVRHKLQKDGLL